MSHSIRIGSFLVLSDVGLVPIHPLMMVEQIHDGDGHHVLKISYEDRRVVKTHASFRSVVKLITEATDEQAVSFELTADAPKEQG